MQTRAEFAVLETAKMNLAADSAFALSMAASAGRRRAYHDRLAAIAAGPHAWSRSS
jgi:hypothetical protein